MGYSVEFQLHLNDYFPNVNLNVADGFFTKRSEDKLIKESNDYQSVLFENNVCKDSFDDKGAGSNVKKVYSDYKQCSLLKFGFCIGKKFKSDIMNHDNRSTEQISELRDSGVETLSYKPLKKPKTLISPDKTISLVFRVCPYCGHVGSDIHDVYPKQIRNKDGMKEEYHVKLYKMS